MLKTKIDINLFLCKMFMNQKGSYGQEHLPEEWVRLVWGIRKERGSVGGQGNSRFTDEDRVEFAKTLWKVCALVQSWNTHSGKALEKQQDLKQESNDSASVWLLNMPFGIGQFSRHLANVPLNEAAKFLENRSSGSSSIWKNSVIALSIVPSLSSGFHMNEFFFGWTASTTAVPFSGGRGDFKCQWHLAIIPAKDCGGYMALGQ